MYLGQAQCFHIFFFSCFLNIQQYYFIELERIKDAVGGINCIIRKETWGHVREKGCEDSEKQRSVAMCLRDLRVTRGAFEVTTPPVTSHHFCSIIT